MSFAGAKEGVARTEVLTLGGQSLLDNIDALQRIDPGLARSLLSRFGDATRTRVLGYRDCALLTLAVLMAIGDAGDQLLTYLAAARRAGVTADEIADTVNLVADYAGAPRAVNAARILSDYLGAERAAALPNTTERVVSLRDHDTTVWDSGGTGTPMLLLHALSMDRRFWRSTWSTLASLGRVVAYDIRGHGYARGAPLTTDLDQLADDAIDVLDALGAPHADVYGASYGGAIAQKVALNSADRVRSLALIATASNCGGPDGELAARATAAERHGMEAQVAVSVIRWFHPETIALNSWPVRYARECVRRDSVQEWAAAWRAMSSLDVMERQHEITVPVVAIGGNEDRSSPASLMREQMTGFPDFQFVEIDGGTHMMGIEQPAALAQALRDFRLTVSARQALSG